MTLRVEISGTQPITCVQEFDVENRLTQVTNLPVCQVTSYGYDGDGNLAWREAGGEVELYIGEAVVIRGLSELPPPPPPTSHTIHLPLVARNASGSPPPGPPFQAVPFEGERYYRLGGAVVGWRVGSSAENVVYWLHADHLGNTSLATHGQREPLQKSVYLPLVTNGYDGSGGPPVGDGLPPLMPSGPVYVSPPDAPEPGTVVAGSETRYASYGEVRTDGPAVGGLTDFTYTGQQVDAQTGLMFYNARWYDPC